jgi:hypothetical protein
LAPHRPRAEFKQSHLTSINNPTIVNIPRENIPEGVGSLALEEVLKRSVAARLFADNYFGRPSCTF